MVVLRGYTLQWMKSCKYVEENVAKAGDQHNMALDVEQALTIHFRRIRKDKRLTNFTSESGQGNQHCSTTPHFY